MKYKHIVFGIEGTLIDKNHLFDGIVPLLKRLKDHSYVLDIITTKVGDEIVALLSSYGLDRYFDRVICKEDSDEQNMAVEPMRKYIKKTGVAKEEILYITGGIEDIRCASAAGVDCALALWGGVSVRHIKADYYIAQPKDVFYMLQADRDPLADKPWARIAMEMQFIAQAGITYSHDPYDEERFERIRELSAELMDMHLELPLEKIKTVFCNETGYQTPKMDSRAAVFQGGKILLTQENNGQWSLPGGWLDVNQSIKSNTIKEVKEETGLDVAAVRLIAAQDRNAHNTPPYAYGICKVFVLCELIGGSFEENMETLQTGYFSMDEIPENLAEEKTTRAQIQMCFDAYEDEHWQPYFD